MIVVYPNPHFPTDTEIVERLLVEMRQYRDKYGIYAAEMLETARLLLDQPELHPRQAEAVAYYIRQAVKEIFGDTRDYSEPLPDMVERVVNAKDRVEAADMVDDGALQYLYRVVNELKDRECSPKPEVRLKELFRKSSGIEPEDGPNSLIREYRRVLKKSNDIMHHVSVTSDGMDKVRNLYEDVADVLTLIFLPTERLARIERLAELPAPQESDLDELRRIMKNAYDFEHFASKMDSPDWFDLMDPDMLKSTSGNPPWLLRSLAGNLKDEHVDAFVGMLGKYFNQWVSDDVGLGELGFVGYQLGDRGLPWLVKTLQVSKEVRMKRDKKIQERLDTDTPEPKLIEEIKRMDDLIWHFDNDIQRAFLKIKQPNSEFIELAEYLLSPTPTVDTYYKTTAIPAKLVEVMNSPFSIQIIKILAKMLGTQQNLNWVTSKPTSVARMSPDSPHKVYNAIYNLHGALKKASDLGISTPKLVGALDTLPNAIRSRFVAWLYSYADDVGRSELVDFIVGSCSSRPPTDDDNLLLDRLGRDGGIGNDLAVRIRSIIGKAPEPAKMVGRPNQWDLGPEKLRCIMWARTMRPWIELPDEWKPCLAIIDGIYEAEYDSGSWQTLGTPETQDNTALADRYNIDDPLEAATEIAAKEPSVDGFPELLRGHSPVSDLENMVRSNASKWVENPVEIIRRLHRPEYVATYFHSLAGAKEVLTPHADQIISAVKFARMHQWDGAISSSPTFYHTSKFENVDMAGMGLIKEMVKEMVKNGVSLGKDVLVDVWTFVVDAIIYPDSETDAQPDFSTHFTLDDKPHVQAVYTMLELMRHTRQNNMEIPECALVRLTKTMRLTGQHGVDYHLCVGSEASFMRQMVPEWFEQNKQYLFGSAASAELGRVALDTYLTWGQHDAFILERYRDGVLDAVKRDISNALCHTLRCMLYGTCGYEPEYVAKSLKKIVPKYISKIGWHMPKLLPKGVDAVHVQRGIAFWDSVLEHPPKPKPEMLAEFGWWADVPGIDQGRWEELMMRTCDMTEKLNWSHRVAERISSSQTITDTGWKILARLFDIDIGYDKEEVVKYSMDALRKTVGSKDVPESRSHLREVLVNHGFNDARQV